jgi:phosphonate transport system substrate-binding protein
LTVLFVVALTGCSEDEKAGYVPELVSAKQTTSTDKVYTFGIHPLHNPNRLHEVFGPVMEYLSANIEGASFKLEASRNYAAYDEKLYAGKFEFSLPNPFQTINSLERGYHVFGKMGDDDNFRGIILVRKDSGIEKIDDLKGKAVSYPAPTALAATMMPQYYLQTHGLDVMKDLDNRYVGSQESSVMNVFLKDTVAGATWPPPWNAMVKERPELAEQMEIKWQTEPLPNNGLVARNDIDAALVERVAGLLTTMHNSAEGKVMLERMELSRFERATDASYKPVVDFVELFSKTVRKVK